VETDKKCEDVSNVLGMVLAGSLTEGVRIKLASNVSTEQIKVGTFVSIRGELMRFFGVVTDVSLDSMDSSLTSIPPDVTNPFIHEVVSGTTVYGTLTVEPMLTLGDDKDPTSSLEGPLPAKTVPAHFAEVSIASETDIEFIFGKEDESHFYIGTPLDMETKLCLDVKELVKRSNGVFGKSGTGKTFLTRLLLIGILQNSAAVNLVFDMHSEYGWKGSSEDNKEVKGLKQLFSSKVAVFSLDEESSRRRGLTPDYVAKIGYGEIEPEDIQLLRETMGLSEVAAESSYNLRQRLGPQWLRDFLNLKSEQLLELAQEISVNERALSTLHNRLSRLKRFDFINESDKNDSVKQLLHYLERGMHVVLEFGRYGNSLAAYILVANILTRRIHDRYVYLKDRSSVDGIGEPRPVVITIEEAHKFLTPGIAGQTIFGSIAREMRKYNVTLLVVDQRPSGIDEEVMSQLGTKITCLLDSERDVNSVLSGVSGSRKLRSVLSRLESKQQALAFGDALPMPVVIRTREYGSSESYRELGWKDDRELAQQVKSDVEDLFGPDTS
tara:strand:- start:1322 stop:2977 length:1656 start_codon:yes stop_codon:yes gene_type:complete